MSDDTTAETIEFSVPGVPSCELETQPHRCIVGVIGWPDKVVVLDHIKHGAYTLPVGKVELDQSDVEALQLEMFQELAISVESPRKLFDRQVVLLYADGTRVPIDYAFFAIDEFRGTMVNAEPDKHRFLIRCSAGEFAKLPEHSIADILFLDYIQSTSA